MALACLGQLGHRSGLPRTRRRLAAIAILALILVLALVIAASARDSQVRTRGGLIVRFALGPVSGGKVGGQAHTFTTGTAARLHAPGTDPERSIE